MMTGIPSDCIALAWPMAAPLLQKVLDYADTGYSLDDLRARCENREMQLWLWGEDAAFLSEIQVFPRYKVFHVPYVAGSGMDEWFDAVAETFEQFARHMGCAYVSGCGRRGWARQMMRRGWDEGFTVVRKKL